MHEFIPLNIALVPERKVLETAIDVSQSISNVYKSEFTLSPLGPFPHITLYYAEFPIVNIKKIKSKLIEYFKDIDLTLEFSSFGEMPNGYIDFALFKTQELFNLHKQIIDNFNEFRNNHIREAWLEKYKDNEEEMDNLEKFGSVRILKTYRPHLTTNKLIDTEQEVDLSSINWDIHGSFRVNRVGLFETGERGTCIKLI